MAGATFGTDHLSQLIGQLSDHLVSTSVGLNVPDRLDPYLQNGYDDAWHESLMVLTEMSDDPDAAAHLAFAIVPQRVPVRGYVPRNGEPIESHAEVSVVFSYRLGIGEDGPANMRRAMRAALDVLRVVSDVQSWAPDAYDVAVEPIERFEPLRSAVTSWLTVRVRFNLLCIAEVL